MFILREIEYKFPQCREELEGSYQLVCARYRERGYIKSDWKSDLWVLPYCAFSTAYPIIGTLEGKVVATISLFLDSPLGLPADVAFGSQLQEIREKGMKLGEIGMLACDPLVGDDSNIFNRMGGFLVVLTLFRLLFELVKIKFSDYTIFITVNPKHKDFYKLIGFLPLPGSPVDYRRLDAPAVALYSNVEMFSRIVERRSFLKKIFLTTQVLAEDILKELETRYTWGKSDVNYFFQERTSIWNMLPNQDKELIIRCCEEVEEEGDTKTEGE